MRTRTPQAGFSTIELLVALGIAGIVAAMAMPSTSRTLADLRLRGDARGIHNSVGVAKMRAAARYSRERLYADLTTNSYKIQYWDKSTSSWIDENPSSTRLSSGVRFGYGALTTPPANTQAAIGQSSACMNNAGTSQISGTACIVFNSRGIPVDSSGGPTGNSAFYVTDGTGTYGVTLSATPLIRLWWTRAAAAQWIQR